MVKFVYSNCSRVVVEPNLTVGKAIEMVTTSPNVEHCVFFNDQKLDNSTVINEIPGIQDHHTLRVISVQNGLELPSTKTTMREIERAFGRMTSDEFHRLVKCMDGPKFKQELLTKIPALSCDTQLLSALCDLELTLAILKKNPKFADEHPLFTLAIREILAQAFNADASNRLFSTNQSYAPSNQLSEANLRQLLNFLPTTATNARAPPPTNLITNDMFANAMQLLGGQGPSTNNPVPQQPVPEPGDLLQLYAAQLALLHEYGFTNDDENVLALTEANGDIELALEVIIRNREENDH